MLINNIHDYNKALTKGKMFLTLPVYPNQTDYKWYLFILLDTQTNKDGAVYGKGFSISDNNRADYNRFLVDRYYNISVESIRFESILLYAL